MIFNTHDFLKQFISQIGIRYLGREWVPNPPIDMGMWIKKSKSDGNGESKSDPLPSLGVYGSNLLLALKKKL